MSFAHNRYLLIKNRTTGVDPLVDSILAGENEVDYAAAKKIFLSPIRKSYVESALLASEDLREISALLEVPAPVLSLYRSIFFDIEDLDKLGLIEVLEQSSSDDEKALKIWSLNQGLDFLRWRLGENISINPVNGLKELFSLSMYKSKEALFSSNSSDSSKEAAKWAKLSLDISRMIKAWTTDSNAARTDLELAISAVVPEFKGFANLDDDL